MPKAKQKKTRVVVVGDVAIDWNVSQTDKKLPWEREVWSNPTPGGAWLLADLVDSMLKQRGAPGQVEAPAQLRRVNARSTSCVHSHLLLREFDVETRVNGEKKKKKVWKAGELLGYTKARDGLDRPEPAGKADLLVIDDANFGYRNRVDAQGDARLPRALTDGPQRLLYKMAAPIGEGHLWEAVAQTDGLVALLHVDDLRAKGCQITQGISWEKTCEELAWALRFHPELESLGHCQALVVQFPATAAFIYERLDPNVPDKVRCRLVFDPTMMEGQWLAMQQGTMVGLSSTLAAALAAELACEPDSPDLAAAAALGLGAARTLHVVGYQPSKGTSKRLRFPAAEAVRNATDLAGTFATVPLPLPWDEHYRSDWTILEQVCGGDSLTDIARTTLRQGLKAGLSGVPVATFKHLETVDRGEIEGYNAIRNLVNEYLKSDIEKPISIGVFGPPGSGKSFGIKQIGKALSDKIESVEFNMSQFNDPRELISALHVVRDIALGGNIPLVFWDEFDSSRGVDEKLFWLKYFLMPMQDGLFREGEIEHPIGRAIFVFAGGTSKTFHQFCERTKDKEIALFKRVKGPDFISRLKGHIDVMGPNQREDADDNPDPSDRYWPIRRAIVLRSLFQRGYGQLMKGGTLNIEAAVANAFLEVSKFKHGVRSMESIIAMSTIGEQTTYTSSALPTAKQMSGHVNADEFNRIVVRPELTASLVDKLARAVYAQYCATTGSRDEKRPLFDELSDDERDSNRDNARHLYKRLNLARCALLPMRGMRSESPLSWEVQERLARQEHKRFNDERQHAGWQLHYCLLRETQAQEDKEKQARKFSRYLVDWDDLPEGIKQYDRNLTDLPRFLAVFGYSLELLDRPAQDTVEGNTPIVHIGIVGRRKIEESTAVRDGIEKALQVIRESAPVGADFVVSSPLAEGADQLVTSLALERFDATLNAVLPLAENDYLKTMDSPGARQRLRELVAKASLVPRMVPPDPELAEGEETTNALYEQAGRWVVDDAHYLIAVWDGKPDKGRGGTAGSVAYARRKLANELATLLIVHPETGALTVERPK